MKKKILFLASESITLKSGGGLANRAFLDSLLSHYPDSVDVVQLQHSPADTDRPHYFFVPPLGKARKLGYMMQGHFHRLYRWLPQFLKIHGSEYSHCVMNQTYYGELIPVLQQYGIKVAVIHHNYEVRFQMDNRLPATLYGLTPRFVLRNERMALELADANLYLTESDYQTLGSAYGRQGRGTHAVVGIFETADAQLPIPPADPLPTRTIAICGSLSNKQTEQSVREVFERYYDIIADVFDQDFRLIITGRDPGQYIRRESERRLNVSLIPNPEHIGDIIRQAGIFLCPVNCGSGLKLRIMDGLRAGLPILTHNVSAQGYEALTGQPWFNTYNDEASFRHGLRQTIAVIDSTPDLRQKVFNSYLSQFSFANGDRRFILALTPFLES